MKLKKFLLFATLETSFWGFHAAFVAYISAYLLSRGVSNTAMSLLLASFLLFSFTGNLVFGRACDRYQTNKRIFIPCMLIAYALMFCIYFLADSLPAIAVCYSLLGFFFQSQSVNADAWVLSAYDHDQKMFGLIRSMPSLFYAFICMIMGRIINHAGYRVMLAGGTVFMALLLLSALLLRDVRAMSGPQGSMRREDVTRLFANVQYRRLIILLFLIGMSIAPINNLKIVMLENVGGNVSHIGVDSFFSAFTQVPFIAMAGLMTLIPLRRRYIAMTALPLAMTLLVRFADSPAMIFAGSFFSNVGFGIILPTMRDVTERYVDRDLRNLGHNLTDAVYNSISGMISLMWAGAVMDSFGVSALQTVCVAIAAVPVLMSLKKPGR